jgi:hypothetical protein
MNYFSEIQQIICMGEGMLPRILQGKTRQREIVFARQLIMYFVKIYSKKTTWAQTASKFGKDHATAMHAVNTIQNLIDTDKNIAIKVQLYRIQIESILNFEKNIVTDKLIEFKEVLKNRIDNDLPITYESIIVYNKLLDNTIKI